MMSSSSANPNGKKANEEGVEFDDVSEKMPTAKKPKLGSPSLVDAKTASRAKQIQLSLTVVD